MCGLFKSCQAILRLLEIIFSALALLVSIIGGRVNPWGAWCEFVWIFCIIVPVVLLVVEAKSWDILLVACIPEWADLCCGLTMLCAAMILSATVIFAGVYFCLYCAGNILCFIFSLVATVAFLVDAVKQKLKCPNGYLSRLRGLLHMSEAFCACIILTAASDYFVTQYWSSPPFGMICGVLVFALCLLVTAAIIVFHVLKPLRALLPLKLVAFVFSIVAAAAYVLAITLWIAFGATHYNSYACELCSYADFITVIVGALINLALYLVDLVLSYKAR